MNRRSGSQLIILIVAFACSSAPTVFAQPPVGRNIAIEQKLNAQVPLDLEFVNEVGEVVSLADLVQDKPVVLNLIYYQCPMLCNMAMDGLVKSLRTLSFDVGDEFTVITVSFDPRETPRLALAAREKAAEHWHFLTGEEESIQQLADAVGFEYQWDERSGQYVHAAGFMILTPEGRVSRYLLGVEYSPRDLRLSLVEASQNEIGTLTDQVLLMCFQYNPLTGKYGLLIQRVLRAAGIATVGLILGAVGLMLRQERRKLRLEQKAPSSAN